MLICINSALLAALLINMSFFTFSVNISKDGGASKGKQGAVSRVLFLDNFPPPLAFLGIFLPRPLFWMLNLGDICPAGIR